MNSKKIITVRVLIFNIVVLIYICWCLLFSIKNGSIPVAILDIGLIIVQSANILNFILGHKEYLK